MMRFYIYLLALQLIAGSSIPFFQTPNDEGGRGGEPEAQPLITVVPNNDTLDFGQVIVGFRFEQTITLFNDQASVAMVTFDPLQGIGADQFTAPAGNQQIGRSGSLRITLAFEPTQTGIMTASYRVSSDTLDKTITLVGRAHPQGSLLPRDTIDFGDLFLEDGPCFDWHDTLVNNSGIILMGTLHSSNPQVFPLLPTGIDTIPLRLQETRPYGVRFCPPDTGLFTATVTYATNAGTRTVIVRGRALRDSTTQQIDSLSASDTAIDFGNVPVDSCARRTTLLINYGTDTVQLSRRSMFPSGLTTLLHSHDTIPSPPGDSSIALIGPGDSVTITYIWCPRQAGSMSGADTLYHLPGAPMVGINLVGVGVPRNSMLDMIDTLDFVAPVGNCETRLITLTNVGTSMITLEWELIDPRFSFDPLRPHPHGRVIAPGASETYGIMFCADAIGPVSHLTRMSYSVTGTSTRIPDSVRLIGTGVSAPRRPLVASTTLLDFGDVPYGQCKRDSFRISNPNDTLLTLLGDSIVRVDQRPSAFTIISPLRVPVVIPARQTLTVVIEYCPSENAADSATWAGFDELDASMNVQLYGSRPSEPVVPFRVWLDSNLFAKVGTPFRLSLRADLPQPSQQRWDSVRIVYNPRSFFPMGVYRAAGYDGNVALRHASDSAVVVYASDTVGQFIGGSIFDLELMGLTTGARLNLIRIDSVYFSPTDSRPQVGSGFVILSGCDLDSAFALSLKTRILGITHDNVSEGVTLVYSAPEGGAPRLSVIDLKGREVRSDLLPVGTGATQSVPIGFADLPPGFYLVELRIGSDRTTTQIMITR